MKKQIFRAICAVSAAVFLASFVLILGILYSYFSSVQEKELQSNTNLLAAAVEQTGLQYLETLSESDTRITWMAPDGAVLFDNRASSAQMENHAQREEIRQALETGEGRSTRYSETLTEKQLYYARRLSDGSVLRLSSAHLSWWVLALGMLQPILFVIGLALALSVFLAYRLANRIVRPLNALDLEAQNVQNNYEELAPFLDRIAKQKNQLRQQERALKRKKEEFDAATENMREGILLLGENGNVLSINHAATRILCVSRYCIGKDLVLFNSNPEIQELLHTAAGGEPAEKTISLSGKDYQFNASPIVTEGKLSGIALIVFDITEKEKAETARREFTANVSHELKTPLQNIAGSAELLAGGMVQPQDVPAFAGNIFAESRRMIALVEDIIQLSRLDEGGCAYEFEQTDLYALAVHTHRSLLPMAQSKGIAFTVAGEQAEIHGIPSLLSEILYNLCDNAIKYNQKDGSVLLTVKNEPDQAVLTVADTGIGIPPEVQDRIFERFYRVDKSRSKAVGGTGLGLSIVKHAALIHHAPITLTSTLGKGTVFSVSFPKEAPES